MEKRDPDNRPLSETHRNVAPGVWLPAVPMKPPLLPFAGLRPELETFIERVDSDFAGAIDRWKQLESEGWDVEAVGATDGSHLIGLGCRYMSATMGTALSA